jgi:hypothetical protein
MKELFVIKGTKRRSCNRCTGNAAKLRVKMIMKVIHEVKPAMKRHVYP